MSVKLAVKRLVLSRDLFDSKDFGPAVDGTTPTWVPVWGPGDPWGPLSDSGSPKGPHFHSRSPFSLFQAYERAKSQSSHHLTFAIWLLVINNLFSRIPCQIVTESESNAKFAATFLTNLSRLYLTDSINFSKILFGSPFLLPKVPIRSPFHSKLGPYFEKKNRSPSHVGAVGRSWSLSILRTSACGRATSCLSKPITSDSPSQTLVLLTRAASLTFAPCFSKRWNRKRRDLQCWNRAS